MKKIFALLCAACMLTASLPACSQGSSESSTASHSSSDTSASDSGSDESSEETASVTTVTEGKLTMATNATFPPYEYYDGNDIVGIDAEIAALCGTKED